jgi:hypothetical protein
MVAVAGQVHQVGDLAEAGFDAVAPRRDDLLQGRGDRAEVTFAERQQPPRAERQGSPQKGQPRSHCPLVIEEVTCRLGDPGAIRWMRQGVIVLRAAVPCGPDLAASAGVRVKRSHQVHDLPEISVKMTEHHVWRVHCGRGRVHVGALPGRCAGPGPVRFGMRIAGPLTR